MLYIRTDANKSIAAGHVMRCIAIANSLRTLGEESVFIISEMEAADIITEHGFQFILIDGRWNNLNYEINALKSLIDINNVRKLLIDSYYITNEYLKNIPKDVSVIYIGSLLKRFERIKLLINYSNVYDNNFYKKNYHNQETKTLLGVKYAPLRGEFQNLRPVISETVDNILITTGSTDKHNITLKIVRHLLSDEKFKGININIIVGRLNDNYDKIEQLALIYDNIVLYSNVKNMPNLVRKNQIAISASGTTIYELCACGVPTVSFALVKEQENNGKKFDMDKIAAYAGSFADSNMTEIVLANIQELLNRYIKNKSIRNETAIKMNKYIDGNGSIRIAKEIYDLDRGKE